MKLSLESLDRILPSLLMSAGVMLLTVGALSYAPSFGPEPSTAPIGGGDPLFTALAQATDSGGGAPSNASGAPNAQATPSPIQIGPSPTPVASTSSGAPVGVATRIRIPALNIDLPIIPGDEVIAGNVDFYPLCDVAMFMPGFVQPGQAGTTYIYAHAQRGMFLPLLRASLVDDGVALVGSLVEVYTSTNEVHVYEIATVKRHADAQPSASPRVCLPAGT